MRSAPRRNLAATKSGTWQKLANPRTKVQGAEALGRQDAGRSDMDRGAARGPFHILIYRFRLRGQSYCIFLLFLLSRSASP
jgi:hypothetical protein